ncbi:MAG: hypothetical protein CMF28_02205 [Kiritimatiellaceae bacterium]|nr:hypothetical protein [Kiritimatiellaceae bacterium]
MWDCAEGLPAAWFRFRLCGMKKGRQLDFNFPANDLLEFPRDLGEEGWFQFYADRRGAFERVEEKFGIPLNQRVRVYLLGEEEGLEGLLTLNRLALPPADADEILLQLGGRSFYNSAIARWERVSA